MPIRFGFLVGVYVNCFAFAMPSFCLRCRSALPSLQVRSYEWEENGTYIGGTWEEEGSFLCLLWIASTLHHQFS